MFVEVAEFMHEAGVDAGFGNLDVFKVEGDFCQQRYNVPSVNV